MAGVFSRLLASYLTPQRLGSFVVFPLPAYITNLFAWQPPQLRFIGGIVMLAFVFRLFGFHLGRGLWDAFILFIVVGAILKFFGKDIFELEKFFMPFFENLSAAWSTR